MENPTEFSTLAYWNAHYAADASAVDWYVPWSSLKPLLKGRVRFSGRFLNIGCGTSPMARDLLKDGFTSVISVDFSDVVVRHMASLHSDCPQLRWLTGDCTQLDLPDNSVDCVLDKGALDCLAAGPDASARIRSYFTRIAHALTFAGTIILVSFGPLAVRRRFFDAEAGDLKLVTTKTITGPGAGVYYVYLFIRQRPRDLM
jgi:SAM-dependent methyltransferase